MSKGNVNIEPVLAVVMRGKPLWGSTGNSTVHFTFTGSAPFSITVICLNWPKQQTLFAFVSVKDHFQMMARWIHYRAVFLRVAFVLVYAVSCGQFSQEAGLSCIQHAHVFHEFSFQSLSLARELHHRDIESNEVKSKRAHNFVKGSIWHFGRWRQKLVEPIFRSKARNSPAQNQPCHQTGAM